jgi:hypothetical protein
VGIRNARRIFLARGIFNVNRVAFLIERFLNCCSHHVRDLSQLDNRLIYDDCDVATRHEVGQMNENCALKRCMIQIDGSFSFCLDSTLHLTRQQKIIEIIARKSLSTPQAIEKSAEKCAEIKSAGKLGYKKHEMLR